MLKRLIFLMMALFVAVVSRAEGEIVVLGESPVAEFTLPDGSALKNAFVWRRSSEGLMIIHDDGQHFLNYKLLPADWKAAYLGVAAEPEETPEGTVVVNDPHSLLPTLKKIPALSPESRAFLLSEGADEPTRKTAIALALLRSLLTDDRVSAKRFLLVIEESEFEISAVEKDTLYVACESCGGDGEISRDCATCSGSGECVRCEGKGERETGIGENTIYCTTCKGSGKCAECGGVGTKTFRCSACQGRGKRLDQRYCEIKLNQLVHGLNARVGGTRVAAITTTARDRVRKVMTQLPGLEPAAVKYYFSNAYNGSKDEGIVVACLMGSLLAGKMDAAEYFRDLIHIHYPDGGVIELEKYLRPCEQCDATGRVERDCAECDGSGKCSRCDGVGERKSEFRDSSTHCTTCRGTGKCAKCGGDGKISSRCSVCLGRGRVFEMERAKVKLKIVVGELNAHYHAGK